MNSVGPLAFPPERSPPLTRKVKRARISLPFKKEKRRRNAESIDFAVDLADRRCFDRSDAGSDAATGAGRAAAGRAWRTRRARRHAGAWRTRRAGARAEKTPSRDRYDQGL